MDEPMGLVTLEGLSGRQRETLALFYRSLLSGKMASSGEVITSLDTPVDLVPMEQTEAEQSGQPVKFVPRPIRVMFNVATYLLIAAMVVGIVGSNIFTNLDRIDIQHGRVLAPMQEQFPTQGGFVQSVEVKPGQHVAAGDIMIRLTDPEIDAALQRLDAQIAVAQREEAQINAGLQELDAQLVSDNTSYRIAVAAKQYTTFIADGDFDDIRQQWLSIRGREPALSASFDPVRVVITLLEEERARRTAVVHGMNADRLAQNEIRDRIHIRAPSDGLVQEVLVRSGQVFDDNTTGVVFEAAEPRITVGWISERFAETVFIGMPATIGLNEDGKKVQLIGVVTDVRAGDHPERPGEFGIIVSVAAKGLSTEAARQRLRLGAPVNLDAKRQLGKGIKTWVAGFLSRGGA